jgi:hypothetical protein
MLAPAYAQGIRRSIRDYYFIEHRKGPRQAPRKVHSTDRQIRIAVVAFCHISAYHYQAPPSWGREFILPGGRPPVSVSRKGGRSPNGPRGLRPRFHKGLHLKFIRGASFAVLLVFSELAPRLIGLVPLTRCGAKRLSLRLSPYQDAGLTPHQHSDGGAFRHKASDQILTDIHTEAATRANPFGAGIMRSRCRYGGMDSTRRLWMGCQIQVVLESELVSRLAGPLVDSPTRFELIHLISNVG